jgi:hypothetical protein
LRRSKRNYRARQQLRPSFVAESIASRSDHRKLVENRANRD